jgi:hypothetical protein
MSALEAPTIAHALGPATAGPSAKGLPANPLFGDNLVAVVPLFYRLGETVAVMPLLIPLGVLVVVMTAMIVLAIVVAIIASAIGHDLH